MELAVMVMRGAIISLPMQAPDRGILQGVLVLFVTLVLLRGTNFMGYKSGKVEKFIQGDVYLLVKDGVLQKYEQVATKITNQQVFEILRSKKIFNLAKVKRMYLEAYGTFSIYNELKKSPGFRCFRKLMKPFTRLMTIILPKKKPASIAERCMLQQ